MHLKDEIEKKSTTTMAVAKNMLVELKQRFGYAVDPSDSKFDPIFITATFLNPAYKAILEEAQIRAVIKYLKELCRPYVRETPPVLVQDDDATYVPNVEVHEPQESEPPAMHPKLLSIVASLLKEKQKDKENSNSGSLPPEEKDIEQYNQENFNVELEDDPFLFLGQYHKFSCYCRCCL